LDLDGNALQLTATLFSQWKETSDFQKWIQIWCTHKSPEEDTTMA
jgi:hypothetical protein